MEAELHRFSILRDTMKQVTAIALVIIVLSSLVRRVAEIFISGTFQGLKIK